MMRRSSAGATKVVVGIMLIVVGLFVTLFSGISFMFRSFGGLMDLGMLGSGLIFLFTGIWMVLDASFSDVEVRVENLDELASVFGKSVLKCGKCGALNAAAANFCARCGAGLSGKAS
ncbi:MAG: hypothetical protein PHF51_00395 [Candidatus ainarchaeum sp.]|nr:hypothetical protein [Candidatus ainarchaeum sp.]